MVAYILRMYSFLNFFMHYSYYLLLHPHTENGEIRFLLKLSTYPLN